MPVKNIDLPRPWKVPHDREDGIADILGRYAEKKGEQNRQAQD
jgi:hypothetical protein